MGAGGSLRRKRGPVDEFGNAGPTAEVVRAALGQLPEMVDGTHDGYKQLAVQLDYLTRLCHKLADAIETREEIEQLQQLLMPDN
jgi:hypothetical protein